MKIMTIESYNGHNALRVIYVDDTLKLDIICDYIIITNTYIDFLASIVNEHSFDLIKRMVGICDVDILVKPADQWRIEYYNENNKN